MNNCKIFTKHLFSKNRVKSIIKNFIIILFLTLIYKNLEFEITISENLIILVTIFISIISCVSVVSEFNSFNNFKSYSILPIRKHIFIINMIFWYSIIVIIERMIFIFFIYFILFDFNINIALYVIITVIFTQIFSINWILTSQKDKFVGNSINLTIFLLYLLVWFAFENEIYKNVFICFLFSALLANTMFYTTNTLIYFNVTYKFKIFKNYFFNIFLREKIVFINSLLLLIIAVFYDYFTEVDSNVLLAAVPYAILSANKIIYTLISQDKHIIRKINTLPHNTIFKQYQLFVLVEMIVIFSTFEVVKYLFFDVINYSSLVLIFLNPIIISVISVFLERNYPIISWNDKNELWKNSRNYIATICIYITTITVLLLFKYII